MTPSRRILVVCTGNTCRSPMAEAMIRRALAEESRDVAGGIAEGGAAAVGGAAVESAGLYAREGDPASENARAAMSERGIDISSHRARALTRDMVERADVVLVMTSAHKEEVLRMCPWSRGKVFTLNEFAGLDRELGPDTRDPYGGPIEAYRAAADDIERAVDEAVRRIRETSTGCNR